MENHITKIYVDSPVFGPEDEEMYQYIDPDIDDPEGFRLEREDTMLRIETREGDRESDSSTESGRYEDMNKHHAEGHSNENKSRHVQSTEVQQRHPFDPPGANRMHKELNEEAEEERLEVERRNRSQRRQIERNHVPQLDLIDSDDEMQMQQGFNDLEIDEGRNSDAYKKTTEMVWMANQRRLLAKGGAEGPSVNRATKTEKVPRPYNHETVAPRSFPAEDRSAERWYPPSSVVNEGSYNPQNNPQNYPQINSQNNPQNYPQINSQNNPQNYSQINPQNYAQINSQNNFQNYPQINPQSYLQNNSQSNPQYESHPTDALSNFHLPFNYQVPPHEVRGFQPFQPYTIESAPPLAMNHFSYGTPMESAWVTDHHETRYQHQRRFSSVGNLVKNLPAVGGANKSKDFIKANKKEVVKKERTKKMYGDMFSKRKLKENVETGPLLRRHSEEVQSREPAPTNTSQNVSGDAFQQPLPVALYQQPVAAASSHYPPQLFPSYLLPVQSMANPSVHPVDHQQRISFPVQIQGVSGLEQQNYSVDINLRLVNPDQPLPLQPSTARNQVQQPNLTGRHLAYNPGTSTAVGLPVSDGQSMVHYGVLPLLAMNPYMVLPPVGDSVMTQPEETERLPPVVDEKTSGRSMKTHPKGGYAELLKRQNQPPQYKEYTLGDYRRLKKEIKTLNLGKLGPDLETEERIEKLVKEKRKQQYSKQVSSRNRQELASRSHRDNQLQQQEDATDRRTIALEYAKTVPKPRIVRHAPDTDLTIYETNRKEERESLSDEIEELQLLKERHNLERKQLELIEMGVKTILSQNA